MVAMLLPGATLGGLPANVGVRREPIVDFAGDRSDDLGYDEELSFVFLWHAPQEALVNESHRLRPECLLSF